MKLSSETLQKLPYFWNKKTQIVFFPFFISSNFGSKDLFDQSQNRLQNVVFFFFGDVVSKSTKLMLQNILENCQKDV